VLLVEQNFALAMAVADYLYVVSAGRFVFQGTPAELDLAPEIMTQHLGLGHTT
jgi:branched-chain amino acid transport system ATP-binding protein